jgi:hypothetical protein
MPMQKYAKLTNMCEFLLYDVEYLKDTWNRAKSAKRESIATPSQQFVKILLQDIE